MKLEDFEKVDCKFSDVQEVGKPCVNSDFSVKLFDYLDKNNLSVDYLYSAFKPCTMLYVSTWRFNLHHSDPLQHKTV